jgi:hypothetical protein
MSKYYSFSKFQVWIFDLKMLVLTFSNKRFQELIESLHNGELSKEEYPFMNEPSSTFQSSRINGASARSTNSSAHSVRTSKPASTWARPRHSDDGYSR